MNKTTKHVDLLDEDKPLAGQKYVCLSFVSPEKIIKQRETFMFEKFVQQWSGHIDTGTWRIILQHDGHIAQRVAHHMKITFDRLVCSKLGHGRDHDAGGAEIHHPAGQ